MNFIQGYKKMINGRCVLNGRVLIGDCEASVEILVLITYFMIEFSQR